MSNPNGDKGARFELETLVYLRKRGFEADKIPDTGRKDESDIVIRLGGIPWVYELKNWGKLDLAGWTREATEQAVNYATSRKIDVPHFGVIHKRRGVNAAGAYVTVPLYEYLSQIDQVPF